VRRFAALVLTLLLASCRAAPPGNLETRVAGAVKRRLTIGGRDDRNPLPATAQTVGRGQAAFVRHCAACHGADGMTTDVPFADAMSPPVPPLDLDEVQRFTDGQLHWIVLNGVSPSGMPAWKGLVADEDAWAMVAFIRSLPSAHARR
jgi:mono/diheme cytochrome c family protein